MSKKPEEMTLGELEGLTSAAAADKGFMLEKVQDPTILQPVVGMACLLIEQMAVVEAHRRGQGLVYEDPALREATVNAEAKYRFKGTLDKMTSEKMYLLAKLLLIASEVGEAIEAALELGTDNPKTSQTMVTEEIADVIIRSLGLQHELLAAFPEKAGKLSVAIATAEKIGYNVSRPYKHGNKLY
jgi:NTP pyrophosphatase (non-canonical NTP hydrolase)